MKTILLIEDNFDLSENTSEILQIEGYKVITARNGKEGIKLAMKKMPDIIFCDIRMPEADGFEVLNYLKNNHSTSVIPFVFLTASFEKKEVQAGLGLGAAGFISKPFQAEELLNEIERCLVK